MGYFFVCGDIYYLALEELMRCEIEQQVADIGPDGVETEDEDWYYDDRIGAWRRYV